MRKILHLDLDAFFCAVEEQRDPGLRGKPFAVGGRPDERGVVASCSYAARRCGVHSAMPMSRALRLCPELLIVSSRHGIYSQVSRQVMERLRALTPLVEQVSIDATDIDRVCLDRARLARYPAAAFSETPAALVPAYCRAEGTELRVIDRIRERVHVSRLDLTQEAPPAPPYNVIVCRNVVIYFDRPTQTRLVDERFAPALAPDGYLFIGNSESLLGGSRRFKYAQLYRCPIYRLAELPAEAGA